jgi:hypothetical protein
MVEWVGRLGAAGADQVMAHFGLGRTVAYRRLGACVDAELLALVRLLHGQPGLYVATQRGLRFAGLDEFSVCRVSVASATHWQTCARLAVWLERTHPGFVVRSERELRVAERRVGRPLASAVLPAGASRRERPHRPDLLLMPREGGRPVVVEVELSVKGPRRLEAICRAWARCQGIAGVRYYATPAAERAVTRAADAVLATEVIDVRPLPAGVTSKRKGEGNAEQQQRLDIAA